MRWEASPDAARGLARQGPADKSVQTETQLNIVCDLFFLSMRWWFVSGLCRPLLRNLKMSSTTAHVCLRIQTSVLGRVS